jgi:hypothetical protein
MPSQRKDRGIRLNLGLKPADQERVRLNAARVPLTILARMMGVTRYKVRQFVIQNRIECKDGTFIGTRKPLPYVTPADSLEDISERRIDRMMRLIEITRKVA